MIREASQRPCDYDYRRSFAAPPVRGAPLDVLAADRGSSVDNHGIYISRNV